MEFYSHSEPEKILLKEHLRYVGERSKKIIESKEIERIDKKVIADISYLIGISHDFGKYTSFFQDKLKGYPSGKEANHSLISALFASELVKRYLAGRKSEKEVPYKFLPLIAYFVVKHHHGNLKDIEDDVDVENLFDDEFWNINKQLSDIRINRKQIEAEYAFLLQGQDYGILIDDLFVDLEEYEKDTESFKSMIKELDKSAYRIRHKNRGIIYYLLVQLLYSVLIDSDKKHAGHVREIKRKELSDNLVDTYLSKEKFKTENESKINPIRNKIRKSVLKNVKLEYKNHKIFTITAPTGTGKTLTSLSAALKLRKLLKKELNLKYEPRIIYSLPFTSIIDQNFDVFDKVLGQIKDFKKDESEYLLKHHYLSEIFYKTERIGKEEDIDKSLTLIESWDSEVIVTTFIQLFHTLIGYKNRSLKKFHNIVNSIIILDEVQNIPIEYWTLVQETLTAITRYFNCRIILMTATKPLIFEEGTYNELVDNHEKYFKCEELNRVCLKIDSDEKQIVEFCNGLADWSKNSYLFVLNTIDSSLEFYKKIKERIQALGLTFEICYLSTNIIPKERKKRIENIREMINKNKKVIVVSTQLIEAGVDIDCDCVYRDMGPLDSIIQVAGRCNRNKRLEQSDMYLLNLVKENKKPYTRIYDSVLLEVVRQILKNKSQISESKFLELINDYFERAKKKSHEETKLIDAIYDLYFYDKTPNEAKRKPISEFKLIKEDYYKIDVFVELDEAKEIWQKYQEIQKLPPLERKKEFLKIKKQFYDYVISIPMKFKNSITSFDEKSGFGYISNKEIDDCYNLETGFKRDSNGCKSLIF